MPYWLRYGWSWEKAARYVSHVEHCVNRLPLADYCDVAITPLRLLRHCAAESVITAAGDIVMLRHCRLLLMPLLHYANMSIRHWY